jgi:hypothetical protein
LAPLNPPAPPPVLVTVEKIESLPLPPSLVGAPPVAGPLGAGPPPPTCIGKDPTPKIDIDVPPGFPSKGLAV